MKTLIFGASGQDGTYLAQALFDSGEYDVGCYDWLPHREHMYCDIRDEAQMRNLIRREKPEYIYHLAAESYVPESFMRPLSSYDVTIRGTSNILEAVKDHSPETRVYFAATSEMFGNSPAPQSEDTPMEPTSPYALAKLTAFKMCQMYRRQGLWVSCGIFFNHESTMRPESFVTRKASMAAARAKKGGVKTAFGNRAARRDWGHVKDAVSAMRLILAHYAPHDFVIGTGESHSVEEMVKDSFAIAGLDYQKYVVFEDARHERPEDVWDLEADCSKARRVLGWKPEYGYKGLLQEMVESDLR